MSYAGNSATRNDGGIYLASSALAMGNDSDTLRISDGDLSMTTSSLSLGAGDDSILAVGGGIELSGTSKIFLGDGSNRLTGDGYNGIFISGGIEGGSGDDLITGVSAAADGPWSPGNLIAPAGIKVWDNSSIHTYSGRDTIKAEGKYQGLVVYSGGLVDTGQGNDRIIGSSLILLNGSINTGAGDDTISSPVAYETGSSVIDMGKGVDRLALNNGSYSARPYMNGFLIIGNSSNGVTNGLYVTGVEFIGGLSGEWQELKETSYAIL